MLKNKINAVVLGATGYVGLDLVYILSKHPIVNIVNLCARKNIGKKINYFDKRIKKNFLIYPVLKKLNGKKLTLFLSLPNGEAQKLIIKIYIRNIQK